MVFQPVYFAQYLYDAVYLYMIVADEMVRDGSDYTNGPLVFNRSRFKTFVGEMYLLLPFVFEIAVYKQSQMALTMDLIWSGPERVLHVRQN